MAVDILPKYLAVIAALIALAYLSSLYSSTSNGNFLINPFYSLFKLRSTPNTLALASGLWRVVSYKPII